MITLPTESGLRKSFRYRERKSFRYRERPKEKKENGERTKTTRLVGGFSFGPIGPAVYEAGCYV